MSQIEREGNREIERETMTSVVQSRPSFIPTHARALDQYVAALRRQDWY